MAPVSVQLLPQLAGSRAPDGSVAVIIDVLRASSTIVTALANGARAVVPFESVEEARQWKSAQPPEAVPLLGGERRGQLIDGFDLDNSPRAYTHERVAGRTIGFTTTNGTRALNHCLAASEIVIGCFLNRSAVVDRLQNESRPVLLVCAGTDGELTAEDILFAGVLANTLLPHEEVADIGTELAMRFTTVHGRTADSILQTLRDSRGGRNLRALGLDADIEFASRCDVYDLVPRYDAESGQIVRS